VTDDIVTRLRKEISKRDRPYPVELLPELREAADEIERLRADKEKCHDIMETQSHEIRRLVRNTGCARNQRSTQFCAEALDAQRDAETLREQLRLANIDNFNTTAEIETLRAERDEAVREAAQARQTIYRLQHELAGCSRAPADGEHTFAGENKVCGLCDQPSDAVNGHGDCMNCAKDQYGA
jgi:chromosome segregation ATPase